MKNKILTLSNIFTLLIIVITITYILLNYSDLLSKGKINFGIVILLFSFITTIFFSNFMHKIPQQYHSTYPIKELVVDDNNRDEYEYLLKGLGGIINFNVSFLMLPILTIMLFNINKNIVLIIIGITVLLSTISLLTTILLYSKKFDKFPRKNLRKNKLT